jgi:hypothetical protein
MISLSKSTTMNVLDSSRSAPVSWIWQELVDAGKEFTLFCDPFAGSGRTALFFKRRGYQVFACDLMQSHYWRNRAIIQNNTECLLYPDHYEAMMAPTDPSSQALFQNWGDHYFTREEAAWLGAWWQNANSYPAFQDSESHLKALVYSAVYLTMNYWINHNQGALQPKSMPPEQVLKHYMQQMNDFVADNQMPNMAYCMDATDLVPQIAEEALLWLYPPAMNGLRYTHRKAELAECWTRRTAQINLEGIHTSSGLRLGQPFASKSDYLNTLSAFMDKCQHIQTWAVGHHDHMGITSEELEELVAQKRIIEKKSVFELPYPSAEGSTSAIETLLIAVTR